MFLIARARTCSLARQPVSKTPVDHERVDVPPVFEGLLVSVLASSQALAAAVITTSGPSEGTRSTPSVEVPWAARDVSLLGMSYSPVVGDEVSMPAAL